MASFPGRGKGKLVRVRQSHFVPPVPYLVADAIGAFERRGVEVDTRRAASSAQQRDDLASREIDVAVTAIDNVFAWNAHAPVFRVAAQLEATTPLAVYSTPGFGSLADLEGSRFAVDALTSGFSVIARALLEGAGLAAAFVERGGVTERLASLFEGSADATLLGPPIDERAEAAGLVRILSVHEAFPEFPGQAAVVRADDDAARGALEAYLDALGEATSSAAKWDDAEGVAVLEHAGLPARSAAALWHARARSLEVSAAGLALLSRLRFEHGMIPAGDCLPDILTTP